MKKYIYYWDSRIYAIHYVRDKTTYVNLNSTGTIVIVV